MTVIVGEELCKMFERSFAKIEAIFIRVNIKSKQLQK